MRAFLVAGIVTAFVGLIPLRSLVGRRTPPVVAPIEPAIEPQARRLLAALNSESIVPGYQWRRATSLCILAGLELDQCEPALCFAVSKGWMVRDGVDIAVTALGRTLRLFVTPPKRMAIAPCTLGVVLKATPHPTARLVSVVQPHRAHRLLPMTGQGCTVMAPIH